MPVEVIAQFENWRRIREWDGTTGWVQQNLLTGKRHIIVAKGDNRPVHRQPDPASALIARAEPGVVARLSECRAAWCRIESPVVSGWIGAPICGVSIPTNRCRNDGSGQCLTSSPPIREGPGAAPRDRLRQRQRAPCGFDMQRLDEPSLMADRAFAGGNTRRIGSDQTVRARNLVLTRREGFIGRRDLRRMDEGLPSNPSSRPCLQDPRTPPRRRDRVAPRPAPPSVRAPRAIPAPARSSTAAGRASRARSNPLSDPTCRGPAPPIRGPASAMSAALRTPSGVSIMHHTTVPAAPRARRKFLIASRASSALSTFGNSTASSGRVAAAARSACPQTVSAR